MEAESMVMLFNALKGGRLQEITQDDNKIQMRILLPELAGLRNSDFTFFYAALSNCMDFYLQPFANESTTIKDIKMINRLGELVIHEAEQSTLRTIKVFCGHSGADSGAKLVIRAAGFSVWDEDFDPMSAAELFLLRKAAKMDSDI